MIFLVFCFVLCVFFLKKGGTIYVKGYKEKTAAKNTLYSKATIHNRKTEKGFPGQTKDKEIHGH